MAPSAEQDFLSPFGISADTGRPLADLSVRVDRALEGGLNLGRNALDYLLKETQGKATQMAVTIAESPGNLASALNRVAEQGNVYEAVLFSPTGSVLAVAGVVAVGVKQRVDRERVA